MTVLIYLEGNMCGEFNKAVTLSTVSKMFYSATMLPKGKNKKSGYGGCSVMNETYLHSAVTSMSDTKIKPFSSFHFWTTRACIFLVVEF